MLSCPICNKEMNYINNSHLKTHGLTPYDFKEKFPNFKNISDSSLEKMSNIDRTNAVLTNKIKAEKSLLIKKEIFLKIDKKCKQCNESISYNEGNNIFCSYSCSASFTNLNRKFNYSEEGLKKLRENGRKTITNNFKKYRDNYVAKVFNLQCKVCKKEFKVNYKKKTHQTCSPKCRSNAHALFNFKQNKTYGKCGYYQGIFCASSWELAFLVFNRDLGKEIKRCDLHFEYEVNSVNHLYFPDFLIDNVIYEIKGREIDDVKYKTQSVIDAGYEINVIRGKEIMPMIKHIKQQYNIKDITQLYD